MKGGADLALREPDVVALFAEDCPERLTALDLVLTRHDALAGTGRKGTLCVR